MKAHFFINSRLFARGRLTDSGAPWSKTVMPVRFAVLEHPSLGPILVDTGDAPHMIAEKSPALRFYYDVLKPDLGDGHTPKSALSDLGHTPADLHSVVLTHYHADHIAGLPEIMDADLIGDRHALARLKAMSRLRRLRHAVFHQHLEPLAKGVRGFDETPAVRSETALGDGFDILGDQSLLAIPLPGHGLGHHGLMWREADRPVLYAADTSWTMAALMNDSLPLLTRGAIFAQSRAGRDSEDRVRAFIAEGGLVHLCHDEKSSDDIAR
ncbi:MBL fold metallo-hydrolase [Cucumibacter marinus]|uniref:MBL fold metallo-hydrolase n=1 Tax=Cucumibacter marinus TaxID=1121252 RepID=UPI000404F3AD|nr:MBL fold metallo-hydrolase [Cucumibacter marinus]